MQFNVLEFSERFGRRKVDQKCRDLPLMFVVEIFSFNFQTIRK